MTDQNIEKAETELIEQELGVVRSAYAINGSEQNLEIKNCEVDQYAMMMEKFL